MSVGNSNRRGRVLCSVIALAATATVAQAESRRFFTSGPNSPWPNVLFADDWNPYNESTSLEPDDAGDGFNTTGYATVGQQVHNFSNGSFWSRLSGTPNNNNPAGAIYSQVIAPGANNDYGTGTPYAPSPLQSGGLYSTATGVLTNAMKLQGTPTVPGNVRAFANSLTAPGGSLPFTNTNIIFSGKVSVDWAPGVVTAAATGSYSNDIQLQNTNAQTVLALRASRLGEFTPGKITLRAFTGNAGNILITDWAGVDIDPNQFYRVEMAANYTGTLTNFALDVSLNGAKVADNIPFTTGGATQNGYAWLAFQNPDATPGTGQADAPKFGIYDNFEWRSSNSLVWNTDAENSNWTGQTWRHGQTFTVNGVPNTPWNYGGVPNASFDRAVFGDVITGPRTVNVNTGITVQHLQFNNAVNSYTLAGSGGVTLAGAAWTPGDVIVVGNHTIGTAFTLAKNTNIVVNAASSLNITGALTATGRSLTKSGVGTLSIRSFRGNNLTVDAGGLTLATDGTDAGTSSVTGLSIAAGSTLDITNNRLIVNYTSATPLADIVTAVLEGRLVSSSTSALAAGIGVIESTSNTFGGQSIPGSAVLVKYTLKGDTNLDNIVNFDDLLALAQNYNATDLGLTGWAKGDFDYGGGVTFDDLLVLAQNYNSALSFEADWALAQSMVPEPATLSVAVAMMGLMSRRRRDAI